MKGEFLPNSVRWNGTYKVSTRLVRLGTCIPLTQLSFSRRSFHNSRKSSIKPRTASLQYDGHVRLVTGSLNWPSGERKTMTTAGTEWSTDLLVQQMTEAQVFGTEDRIVSFELDGEHTRHDQFASNVFYATIVVRSSDHNQVVTDNDRRLRLVIKMKHRVPELRAAYKNDLQFHNEIFFYEQIVPVLITGMPNSRNCAPSFCRYFYGRNNCGDLALQDLIVLQNETYRGYRSALIEHRVFLDFDHLVVALKALARFHGLSYIAKHVDMAKFENTIMEIKETQWSATSDWTIHLEVLKKLFITTVDRLVERLGGKMDEQLHKFQTELLEDLRATLLRIMEPAEPLAVLCHGDFNRNNLLFRYDDGGKPVDAMAFDMATVRYGSPALDLSFFLYMNTDQSLRDAHWDELLDTYCAELAASVSDVRDDAVPVPDRQSLDAEFRDRAFYGLSHVSFFLRIMMDEHPAINTDIKDFSVEEKFQKILSFGGERSTNAVVDTVRHYIDLRYSDVPR